MLNTINLTNKCAQQWLRGAMDNAGCPAAWLLQKKKIGK